MHNIRLLAALLLTAGAALVRAADPAPPPPAAVAPAPPPQWERALPVTVIIGDDVSVGADTELSPAPLLFKVDDPKRLRDISSKVVECVIDAEGNGNLAAGRVSVRLSAIRCFEADGSIALSKTIRGYVVDNDARAGIKGVFSWSQAAKDLTMLGVGTQAKQNFLMRGAQTALSHATFGIGDGLISHDEEKNGPPPEAIHELRSADTLLPVLTIEPGRALRVVILSGVQ